MMEIKTQYDTGRALMEWEVKTAVKNRISDPVVRVYPETKAITAVDVSGYFWGESRVSTVAYYPADLLSWFIVTRKEKTLERLKKALRERFPDVKLEPVYLKISIIYPSIIEAGNYTKYYYQDPDGQEVMEVESDPPPPDPRRLVETVLTKFKYTVSRVFPSGIITNRDLRKKEVGEIEEALDGIVGGTFGARLREPNAYNTIAAGLVPFSWRDLLKARYLETKIGRRFPLGIRPKLTEVPFTLDQAEERLAPSLPHLPHTYIIKAVDGREISRPGTVWGNYGRG